MCNVHQLPPDASPSSQKCSFLVYFEEYSQKCTKFKNAKFKSIIFKSVFLPECASATTRCITIPPKVQPAIFNIEIQMKRGKKKIISRNEIKKHLCRMKYDTRASWPGQNII